MKPDRRAVSVIDVEACVRSNTGSAALTGALLVFFGFFWFGGVSGSGTLLIGDTLFHWTLRAGGLLMIGVAVWCSIGVPIALLVDAMLSLLIGVLLIVSAAMLLAGGGFKLSYPVYAVCGVIFITYGLRDWREYRRFPADDAETEADTSDEAKIADAEPLEQPSFVSPLPSAGDQLQERRRPSASPRTGSDGQRSAFAAKK
ncbi:MAG: hypothetical protein ACE5HE_12195, partial [Phycisphaerae bacterium]